VKPIIEVRNLSKKYKIGEQQRYLSLRDSVSNLFSSKNTEEPPFWALDDVSFDVQAGESIGIIGRNGAGKSTLLKILSRITPPTKGSVILRGRMASLLEVGTGFHSELTGRENVFMNGSILGLKKREIEAKFDEIVDFSGVEQFIDTPLKHYSSGMQLRLAFAVAAHLEPEILVIDEVLAVGDAEFQKRCLGKMDEVSKSGRTVLFVSHNLQLIQSLCQKGIVLEKGILTINAPIDPAINYYLDNIKKKTSESGEVKWSVEDANGSEEMKLLAIRLKSKSYDIQSVFRSDEKILIEIEYIVLKRVINMRINFQIRTKEDFILFSSSTHDFEDVRKEIGIYQCTTWLPSNFFNQGTYSLYIQAGIPNVKELLKIDNYLDFHIEKLTSSGTRLDNILPGFVAPLLQWETIKKEKNEYFK
jgi:lipopolysaccharide transport system ATP-binding protein